MLRRPTCAATPAAARPRRGTSSGGRGRGARAPSGASWTCGARPCRGRPRPSSRRGRSRARARRATPPAPTSRRRRRCPRRRRRRASRSRRTRRAPAGRDRILAMLIEAGGSVNTGNGLSLLVPVISQGLTRTYPYFLQAGAVIPTGDELDRFSAYRPGCYGHNQLQDPYLQKVLSAGSFANYAKAHRARLLAILAPKFPHLPKEMVSVVIGFWAHVGFY